MIRFFKSRRPGPTDLTWEEKNFTDYIYHPKDTGKLQDFIKREFVKTKCAGCMLYNSTKKHDKDCFASPRNQRKLEPVEKPEREREKNMDAETLYEVMLLIIKSQMDINKYAGDAFLMNDEENKQYFKGFYNGLNLLHKDLDKKYLRTLVEEDKMFAEHVIKQMASLENYDHVLFECIIQGLTQFGWKEDGGSDTYRLLNYPTRGCAIKVFRNEEAPEVIKIAWTAPPELEKPRVINVQGL